MKDNRNNIHYTGLEKTKLYSILKWGNSSNYNTYLTLNSVFL